MGWAAMPGTGFNGVTLETTTGGGNATPVTVDSMDALNAQARGDTPAVIYVSGALSGSLVVGSNKTIIGQPGARIDGNIQIGPLDAAEAASSELHPDGEDKGVHNVIIRNLIVNGGEDTININYSHHIWLDHLDISDGSDGIIDIVRASDYITVSWSKIYYTRGGGHRLASLVGNRNDLGEIDTDRLQITFHHNWWGDGIQGRQPRVRFGKLHLFNNLHTSTDGGYAVRCGVHANIRSERNVYVKQDAFDYSDTTDDAVLESVEDLFIDSGSTSGNGTAFTPPYPYTADPTEGLRAYLEANTGPK
jgi:pectate lyase